MSTSKLSRTPPVPVRRALRQEVGFGCPVDGCNNPYLEYHHFDPPWHIEQHHDPTRMIALCATHHAKADAWTIEQVRELKQRSPQLKSVEGRFEWMRDDVLAIIGGNYYYETPHMVVFRNHPLIWFHRDEKGRLLLNLNMLTASSAARSSLVDNDWIIQGNPEDVESPPNGSYLRVKYTNGDEVSISFTEWQSAHSLREKHSAALKLGSTLRFPLITAEVGMVVGGTDLKFGPTSTNLGGVTMTGNVIAGCQAGLAFG